MALSKCASGIYLLPSLVDTLVLCCSLLDTNHAYTKVHGVIYLLSKRIFSILSNSAWLRLVKQRSVLAKRKSKPVTSVSQAKINSVEDKKNKCIKCVTRLME